MIGARMVSLAEFTAEVNRRVPHGAGAELLASCRGLVAVLVTPAIEAKIDALEAAAAAVSPSALVLAPASPSATPPAAPAPASPADLASYKVFDLVPIEAFQAMIAQRAPAGGPAAEALHRDTNGLRAVRLTVDTLARLEALEAPAPAVLAPAQASPVVTIEDDETDEWEALRSTVDRLHRRHGPALLDLLAQLDQD